MSIRVKEVLKTRKYKAGYEVRTEIWLLGGEIAPEETEIKSAYTLSGDYIGSPKEGHYLVVKRGIKPEKANKNHGVCSIGFCETDKKWYGWSHRSICGFGIGSTCKMGDCGFVPKNREEFIKDLEIWYTSELYENMKIIQYDDKVVIEYNLDPKSLLKSNSEYYYSDVEFGRGEWTAETLEDARQMAIDFAGGVS